MKFSEIIDQASDLLRRKGRLSYRALKVEFALSDEQLEALTEELLFSYPQVKDEGGRGLVWMEPAEVRSARSSTAAQSPAPASYTPRHLAERILAEQAAMEARGTADGERKVITALFADIKGSMELIEDLDPEEARAIIDPALHLMMEAVHRYEGYVAQSTGDGIFALFGAPLAHEDHPQRGLYAALKMQEDAKRYAEQLRREKGLALHIRVGVNTGEVVVRSIRKEDLHTDYVPVGHSISLAARLESLAAPGTSVVSEHTYRLTEGYFQFKDLGATRIKGVSDPLRIYEVLGVGPLRTRLQVATQRGLVRFVGRQSELAQLERALALAQESHGQIVGVMGEPGVGKSRLFYEFKLLSQNGCLVLETFSVSHGKAYPYLPLIDLLKHYCQITLQDDERKRREKLTGKVLTLDRSLEDTLPYLFALLGIAEPASPLLQMDPQLRRRRTFEALKRVLVRESCNQPLILIFEDLHWLDAETQAFLTLLSESIATARILLLVNYRPEYHHEWGNKTYYSQLRLDPLGQAEAHELLTALLGEAAELQALKRLILEKTEGNPFFMEEVVQTLAEEQVLSGERGHYRLERAPTTLRLPSTVQGVLAARIDRLPAAEKELLQTLAVIGKEFAFSLLQQVVAKPEEELYRGLSHLQGAEFIYEQVAFPEMEYTFKHALTQEVAYNSVLSERRRLLHERTAQGIEAVYRYQLEDHYSELARHYRRSSNTPKAVEYLQLAGQQAAQQSANAEAITHLSTALELLKALPDTPTRTQQELTLHLALGAPLLATKGYTAPELEATYSRALALCRQEGEPAQRFPALAGLWEFYATRAEYRTSRELAEQLLALAQSAHDPALRLGAHDALGQTFFMLGELTRARSHFKQSLALYDPAHHHSLITLLGGEDPGVACQSYTAWTLWLLGYPAQARQRMHEALTLAQELRSPFNVAFALTSAAFLHLLCREGQAAYERVEALMRLATEQGFAFFLVQGPIFQGGTLAAQGQIEAGITQMRQGLAAYRTMGAETVRPYFLALLAEAYGKAEQAEEGLSALAEALDLVAKTGERWYEAELYRLKGELTLQKLSVASDHLSEKSRVGIAHHDGTLAEAGTVGGAHPTGEEEAGVCFLKAIEIARRQQAKSWELRAVISLSRLWQQQGREKEAHEMLAEIYGWFTEGFDTKDLQEARALLATLA